ncbi:hypothetical protein Bbelb_049690 [Branchiostoma belcheri]|nr:hypothetical protein Bbelb_049690 [Branchiostoma belcheri]
MKVFCRRGHLSCPSMVILMRNIITEEEAEEGQHFPNVARKIRRMLMGDVKGTTTKDMMAALLDHYLCTIEQSTSSSTTWRTPTWQTVALNHTDVCTEAHSVTWYGVGETLVAFTDSASHQVKVVMQSGQVQTLAGNGRPGLQDGTLPLAEFHQPRAAFYGHMATKGCSKCLKPFSRNSDNRVDYSGFEEEDP